MAVSITRRIDHLSRLDVCYSRTPFSLGIPGRFDQNGEHGSSTNACFVCAGEFLANEFNGSDSWCTPWAVLKMFWPKEYMSQES